MKNIFKAFFCNSEGKFIVPYFWSTFFLAALAVVLAVGIITGVERPVATTTLGGIALALIGLYNNGKRNRR